ncbi:hypothetical protein [Pontibacter harenae]|uniref:hypothetical protein n=1 Tax=Pontibacter harenae TaxID=2894083 RepID=UPI001E43CE7D|nr:hypothetical protein [Pontibacter harenae]MCC9169086.1 hypothetical protein [Pontibacter harenae]
MLQVKKHIGRCLSIPLCWVMLLWALTLPGHEVEVYRLLLQGSPSTAMLKLLPKSGGKDKIAVQQQSVQAFLDAEVPSSLVLDLRQLERHPLLLLAFAASCDEPSLDYATTYSGIKLSERLFPVSIQPNAP